MNDRLSDIGMRWLCVVLGFVLLGAGCRASTRFAGTPAPGRPENSLWKVGTPIVWYMQGPGAGLRNPDRTLTPLGKAVRQIHPEFVAIGEKLQPLTSLAVYHLGTVPEGGVELPADAGFTVDPAVAADKASGILLGYFGTTDDPSHVLVVNLDYTRDVTTTVVGPGPMEVFDAEERKWNKASDRSRATVSLMPGGGKLVRLRARPSTLLLEAWR